MLRMEQVRCVELHTGRVNEISFDRQEEHIATCSDDCTVTVRPCPSSETMSVE